MTTVFRTFSTFAQWLRQAGGQAFSAYARGCAAYQDWSGHDSP